MEEGGQRVALGLERSARKIIPVRSRPVADTAETTHLLGRNERGAAGDGAPSFKCLYMISMIGRMMAFRRKMTQGQGLAMPSQAILPAETTDKLLKAMLVLSRTIEHILETRAVEEVVNKPLSSSKVRVLRLLGNRGWQTSVQISRYLGVSKPAVTQIVGSLVRSKLVVRRPGQRDRREIVLQLTKLGRDKFRAVRQKQRHLIRNALRLHEDGQAEHWIDTLQEIAAALAQADQAFEKYCLQCGAHADGTCILVGGDANCPFLQHRSAASDPPGARRRS